MIGGDVPLNVNFALSKPLGQLGAAAVPGVYPATPAGGVLPSWKILLPPNQTLLTPPSGVVYHKICALSEWLRTVA